MVSGVQLAVRTLREPLEQTGFRKRAGEVFTIVLADGVLGWLGLNHASRHRPPGQIAINPVVGVRHQAAERLIASLRREAFHEYQPPTVSTPIGYVMPAHRYIDWEFGGQHGTAAGAELFAAVADYGIPFMRSLIQLPAILEAINQGLCHNPEYRLPAVLEVMGRHNDAMAAVARAVDELGERHDAAAQQLRHFAAALGAGIDVPLAGDLGDDGELGP
jgi:hypothetical protein